MIDNPNPRNFYSKQEMIDRENYIPKLKNQLLSKIEDIKNKIENEERFPHGNMDIEFLSDVDDKLEDILNNWYY